MKTASETVKAFFEAYKCQRIKEVKSLICDYTDKDMTNAVLTALKRVKQPEKLEENKVSDFITDVIIDDLVRVRCIKDIGIGKPSLEAPFRLNLLSFTGYEKV